MLRTLLALGTLALGLALALPLIQALLAMA